MVFHSFNANRLEGAVANVQGDFRDLDSLCTNAIEQFRSEVQTGGWSCDSTALTGEYGLITLGIQPVLFIALDVRRQRGPSDAIDDFIKVAVRFEANDAAAG